MTLNVSRTNSGEDQENLTLSPFLSTLSNNAKVQFKIAVNYYLVQSFFDNCTYKIDGFSILDTF